MTDKEIFELMLDCGLQPIEQHEWTGDHFVNSDSFIDGDIAGVMQFAKEIIRITREECLTQSKE